MLTLPCGACGRFTFGEPYAPGQCYLCWLAAHNPTYRKAFNAKPSANPVQPKRDVTKCKHLLDVLSPTDETGQRCACQGKWLRECRVHGKCTWEEHRPGVVDCRHCPAYTQAERDWPDDPRCMVAIGHYNMPGVIELQAKLIRATCGDVPILVSDDHTEEAGKHGPANLDRLKQICTTYGLLYRQSASHRCGHSGGDLGPFFHGLEYAKANGVRVVCKLSQRFVIDRPRWLQDTARRMIELGQATAGHRCTYQDRHFFNLRTECVFMDAQKWHRPDLLAILQPRRVGPVAAEMIVWPCVPATSGSSGTMYGPDWFTSERPRRHRHVVWHDSDMDGGRYMRLADQYGVDLGDGYHSGGSHLSPAYLVG